MTEQANVALDENLSPEQSELKQLIKDLKPIVDKKNKDLLDNAKIEKLSDRMNALEDKIQNSAQEKALLEKKNSELEKKLARMPNVGSNGELEQFKEEYKNAFDAYVLSGEADESFKKFGAKNLGDKFSKMQLKYLRTDSNPDGGFLVVPQYNLEIIKKITEVSPVRQVAKVRTCSSNVLKSPTRSALLDASWVGEGQTDSLSASTYGLEEMPLNKLQVTVYVDREELEDAAFDISSEIMSDVGERFGQKEGAAFVSGSGVATPEGFMTNSSISTRNSGIANSVDFQSIMLATGDLKKGYNPIFMFNRKTRAVLMTLANSVGTPLWMAGNIAAGVPSTIAGYTYVEAIDMDDLDTNKYPIIFGDFARGYLIGDRTSMSMIRDDFTGKRTNQVQFTFHRRVGGQVILAEAFIKIKCAA